MENTKNTTNRGIWVSIFAFLYTFTRQSFLPNISKIDLHGLDGNSINVIFAFIYSCLQIPYGILLDYLGINKMVMILSGIMSLGTATCALSSTATMFTVGRLITALGCAGAFISTVKTIGNDYGIKTVKSWVGNLVSGAILFTIGFNFILDYSSCLTGITNGWRYFYGIKSIILFSVFLYFAYLNKKTNGNLQSVVQTEEIQVSKMINIVKNDVHLQCILLFSIFFFAIFYTINETTYLPNLINHQLKIRNSTIYNTLLAGFLSGFIGFPYFLKKFKINYVTICLTIVGGVSALSLSMIFFKNSYLAMIFLYVIGISNSLQLIILEMASRRVPSHMTGLLSGLMNVLFVGGAFPFQKALSIFLPSIGMGAEIIYYGAIVLAIISGFFMFYHHHLNNYKDIYIQ